MPRFCLEPWRDGALITLTEQTAGKEVCWTVSVLVLLLQDHVSTHWHFQGQRQCLPLGRQKIHTEQRSEWIIKYNPGGKATWSLAAFMGSTQEAQGEIILCSQKLLWAGDWHLASASTWTDSWATATTDPQHPLKGAQGGDQEWGTLCSGKTGRTGLQIVRYFQEKT